MIEQIYKYFSIEIIYLWLNLSILPFWFMLIFFPQSKICRLFILSIFPILILSSVYCFVAYLAFQNHYNFFEIFRLYSSLNNLLNLFSDKLFLILFWIHFLAINLFCGGWIVSDSQKFGTPKILVFFPLIITYLVGPLGIMLYWLVRIFYSKKINLFN